MFRKTTKQADHSNASALRKLEQACEYQADLLAFVEANPDDLTEGMHWLMHPERNDPDDVTDLDIHPPPQERCALATKLKNLLEAEKQLSFNHPYG